DAKYKPVINKEKAGTLLISWLFQLIIGYDKLKNIVDSNAIFLLKMFLANRYRKIIPIVPKKDIKKNGAL
ncbi:unnamed protein product, partial [marine sediment metagenome]